MLSCIPHCNYNIVIKSAYFAAQNFYYVLYLDYNKVIKSAYFAMQGLDVVSCTEKTIFPFPFKLNGI